MSQDWLDAVRYDADGLVPAIAQDAITQRVLTLAWMNRAALERTVATGEVHYWSRSRAMLWHKGEQSGHVQRVREVRLDCDGDAILLIVEPAGRRRVPHGSRALLLSPAARWRMADGGARHRRSGDRLRP